ncbi:hypothetical protein HYW73_03880 [Candidatus Nomurabacteria bacterium]|nr:hypothetical protein [Candidatus Nomurabacteria bacterium]
MTKREETISTNNLGNCQKINIAGLIVDVYVDNKFIHIKKFVNKFITVDIKDQTTEKIIYISESRERKLELSKNLNTLLIAGPDIDNFLDPFNVIGVSQAMLRFAAIHLAKIGVLLLHGSVAVWNNEIVCFGDDGSSAAKTLGSLEVALESKQYVADEFCFVDIKNNKIFGYPFIPVHIRPIVKKHLKDSHDFSFQISNYEETVAGDFIYSNESFHLKSGELKILSYIHFSKTKNTMEKLSEEESFKSFKFCAVAHIAKLLHPELDRMQFVSMTDSVEDKIIDESVVNEVIEQIIGNKLLMDAFQKFTSYRLYISKPCNIIDLFRVEI